MLSLAILGGLHTSASEFDVVDGARSRHRTTVEWSSQTNHVKEPGSTMQITTIGLDIAKNVFQVHGIDDAETVVSPSSGRSESHSSNCPLDPQLKSNSLGGARV
jgi:hypothetical protein